MVQQSQQGMQISSFEEEHWQLVIQLQVAILAYPSPEFLMRVIPKIA